MDSLEWYVAPRNDIQTVAIGAYPNISERVFEHAVDCFVRYPGAVEPFRLYADVLEVHVARAFAETVANVENADTAVFCRYPQSAVFCLGKVHYIMGSAGAECSVVVGFETRECSRGLVEQGETFICAYPYIAVRIDKYRTHLIAWE